MPLMNPDRDREGGRGRYISLKRRCRDAIAAAHSAFMGQKTLYNDGGKAGNANAVKYNSKYN